MSDGSIQQQTGNGQNAQIFKAESTGNNHFRFVTQDGTNRVAQSVVGNYGEGLTLGNYVGGSFQEWNIQQNGTSGNFRVFTDNSTTWDLRSYGNDPVLQLWGNTTEPFYDYRSFRFNAATCPATTQPPTSGNAPIQAGACYTIQSQINPGNNLQAIGDGSVQQIAGNGQANQIWKADDAGNGRFRFTTQSGTNQVMTTPSGTYGEGIILTANTGATNQQWNIAQNGSSGNYRMFTPGGTTWDLRGYATDPVLQLWGNTSEPFQTYRSFRFNAATCPNGTPPATTRCAAFIDGTEVAFWAANPTTFTVKVRDDGTCRQAVWLNNSIVNRGWLPSLTPKPGFTIDDIGYCLTYEYEACNRPASVTPPATAFGGSAARVSTGDPATANDELVFYPNPTSDLLTVSPGYALPPNPTFTLSNVLGRVHELDSQPIATGSGTWRLSVRHLPTGLYLLRITGEGLRPRTIRFVKQ